MEHWRDIPGYAGRYQVSSVGRVRSLDRVFVRAASVYREEMRVSRKGKMLKPGIASSGYPSVCLGSGNTMNVHVLVALAFLGEPPFPGAEVRHLNDDRRDNRVDNLAWGSRSDNNRDKKWNKGQSTYKLKPKEAAAIKKALSADSSYGAGAEQARKYGVSEATISSIKTGRTHIDV